MKTYDKFLDYLSTFLKRELLFSDSAVLVQVMQFLCTVIDELDERIEKLEQAAKEKNNE